MIRGWTLPVTRTCDLSLRHRFRTRFRLEELEARTLPAILTPAQIISAYNITGDGAGQTIAIIDAYYDPTIKNDLATFNTRYGLASLNGLGTTNDPTLGTFYQIDLSGGTLAPPGDNWALETALDVEWAHAIAPKANIVLIEGANDFQDADGKPTALLNAVQEAVAPTHGQPKAQTVSMSWGINEVPNETQWDSVFNATGVTFVAASGDSGAGTIWPATSPYVVSVGGTTLKLNSANKISSETGWGYGFLSFLLGGSGGGFSQFEPLPSYQQKIPTTENGFQLTSFGARLNPDVAYDGNPSSGFAVYSTSDGGWVGVGGTSAGAPQWAALIAIADAARGTSLGPLSSTQTLNALYSIYSNNSTYAAAFNDTTSGNTGTYQVVNDNGQVIGTIPVKALAGYDLVTGLGTPKATQLVKALATFGTSPSSITKAAPAPTAPASSASSSGNSASSHPTGSSGKAGTTPAVVNDIAALQNSLLIASLNATPPVLMPASASNNGFTPAFFVAPVVPSQPFTPVFSSTTLLSKNGSGGGGDDLADQLAQVPDNQAATPAAPADAPAPAPATPAPRKAQPEAPPAPKMKDPVPDEPDALDAVFLQVESLPGLAAYRAPIGLLSAKGDVADRSNSAVVVLGLAAALALYRLEQPAQAEEDEGRRLQV